MPSRGIDFKDSKTCQIHLSLQQALGVQKYKKMVVRGLIEFP